MILVVIPWSTHAIGGVSTVVRQVCSQWNLRGVACAIAVDDWAASRPRLEDGEFRLRLGLVANPRGGVLSVLRSAAGAVFPLVRLARFLRANECTAVNFHYPGLGALSVSLLKRLGVWSGRLVLSFHGTDVRAPEGRFERWAWRMILAQADCSTAVSKALAARVANALMVPATSINVVYNGVDPAMFCPAHVSAQGWISADAPMLVSVGHFVPRKNHEMLIRAVAKVRSKFHTASLMIVGMSGDELPRLRAIAHSQGLSEAIHFRVDRPPGEVADLFRRASVAVQPSLQEPFGLAVVEAAACGTPLVVSAVGGHLEIVRDGATALTFDPVDVDACAAAILNVLERPGEARQRADRLLAEVHERFTWASCAENYLRLLEPVRKSGAE